MEKWGPFLLQCSPCGLFTVPTACSVCQSVSLLLVCLSLALFCPLAPTVLAWAEPYMGVGGPWAEG